MIIYTPLCETDVFPVLKEDYPERKCITHHGKLVYVEKLEDGSYELLQLLSTNPHDYLQTDFTPGNVLHM